jgi:PAS domain S-box-containing protein
MIETQGAELSRQGGGHYGGAGSCAPLHFSAEEMRQIGDAGSDWIWETDSELRFSWLSSDYERVTGASADEVLGRFRFDFLNQVAKGSKSAIAHLEDLQARRPFRDFVYQLADGQPDCRWISITGFPKFDSAGVFLGYRGVARNVTRILAAFEEFEAIRGGSASGADLAQPYHAGERNEELLFDLERTIDSMKMGVVLLDAQLNAEIINKAFYDIWKLAPGDVTVGSPFRALMDINRHNGIYDVDEVEWERYVASRLAEIKAGDVAPREFRRADGCTMIYSVTALSGGKRLVSYYDVTEMKQREAELAETHERSRLAEAVIDAIKDPIFVKDSDLNFVFVNKAFASLFGKEPQAMLGRKGGDFLDPAEVAAFEESERHVLATGELYEIEENSEFPGIGKSRIVRKNRVRTESGNDYVCCFLFDVSEIKARQTEAEEARKRLADVLESMPAGVIIYDRDDRFVFANRKLQESLPDLKAAWEPGRSLRSALEIAHSIGYFRNSGDPSLDKLYDSNRDRWIERYLERYHVDHAVSERQAPDGGWHQVFDTRTPDGTFVGVRVDITELKRREKALRDSMRQIDLFRHVLDELPVSTYVKNDALAFEFVNKAWANMTGVSQEAAIGLTDRDFFGEEGEGFAERDLEVLRTGELSEFEESLTHPDGTVRQLIAKKSRLISIDGTVHLIGSSTDITELKQRESELQEAQRRAVLADRAKSEFLANMSHEIRTPMNGVLGMAELLAKSELDSKQKTFTDIIVKSGNALLTIINDILDFSKIDAGQLILDPAPFNLAEAIEDVATLVSTRAKEKDLELIVRVAPNLHDLVIGDVGRIRQIVTNLVGNAVKFTDSGHVLVDVTGEMADSIAKLRISVTDTGIGIPREKLRQVFEKFSQVDASSTRRHEGTGLGLAITSRLVDLMGGEIGVDSTEGKGSTFWFTLALPSAGRPNGRKAAPVDVTGARILVVDDNGVNRAILTEQMASWTFDSCAAESGAEGLKVLEAAAAYGVPVDCVVLDYQMPGMTGAEMARIIRTTPNLADTPIVMLTSVDQSLVNASYRDLSIDAQLIKPARSSTLLEALVASIQKRRSAQGHHPAAPATPEIRIEPASPIESVRPRSRPARPNGQRLDILVAEDNEVNQLVFTQILGETDCTFQIVGNGRLAVAAFQELNPGMILMDVSMPDMNGLEATAAIRELEGATQSRVPIVGVTAHALKGDRERCIEAGMDDYLPKPISPKALLDKIERWARDKAAERRDAG